MGGVFCRTSKCIESLRLLVLEGKEEVQWAVKEMKAG